MNQFDRRLAQMEASERTRINRAIDDLIRGLDRATLHKLAEGATDDQGRLLATMTADEVRAFIEHAEATYPLSDLRAGLEFLHHHSEAQRAPLQ